MLTRQDLIEQSVTDFLREQVLTVRGYPADQVEIIESYPYAGFVGALEKSYIAVGFNFDDGGEPGEVGSDLIFSIYTLEFWIFGTTSARARNLANGLKYSAEVGDLIPLKNYAVAGAPVIDQLVVESSQVERQAHPNPEPWREHVYTVTLRVSDEHFASAA